MMTLLEAIDGVRYAKAAYDADKDFLIERVGSDLYLSYRGTACWSDVRSDLDIDRALWPFGEGEINDELFLHRGFLNQHRDLYPGTVIAEHARLHPSGRFICTGHSLGGALACLAALRIAEDTKHQVRIYTYGAPAIGGREFCQYLDRRVPMHLRIVHDKDPVPRLLPAWTFRHAGRKFHIAGDGSEIGALTSAWQRLRYWLTWRGHDRRDHDAAAYRSALLQVPALPARLYYIHS